MAVIERLPAAVLVRLMAGAGVTPSSTTFRFPFSFGVIGFSETDEATACFRSSPPTDADLCIPLTAADAVGVASPGEICFRGAYDPFAGETSLPCVPEIYCL